MKVLLIANSFGENLQRYAHQIAEKNRFDLDIYTLYIGGCSLERHVKNLECGEKAYSLFHNGKLLSNPFSLPDMIDLEEWDYISLQQSSHFSGYEKTYYPYLRVLISYIKKHCPRSKIIFHQTWPYSSQSEYNKYKEVPTWCSLFNFKDEKEMKKGIDSVLKTIRDDFKFAFIINSGDVVCAFSKMNRFLYDEQGFHMSDAGCYLIGANLVKLLFGKYKEIYSPRLVGKTLSSKIVEYINR